MSLLMQALKKAERAKQNSTPEAELEKPSEAFDDLLDLAPLEPATPAATNDSDLEFTLDLEPLDGPAPPPPPAASAPPPLEPSLAPLSFEAGPAIPELSVADEAIHDPVPPQARQQPGARPAPPPAAQAAAQAAQASQGEARARAANADVPRAAARARAAAATAGQPAGLDPAKLRLAVLSGIAVLIAAVFGYIYWQATTAPGPGARLPMVPMPPPGAADSAPPPLVVAPPAASAPANGEAPPAGAPAAGVPTTGVPPAGVPAAAVPPPTALPAPSAPFAAAPAQGGQPSRDEDREIQRERDMMLTQQALNAQKMATAQAGAPKPAPGPDTLAPLAAPDSSDIKVARSSVPTQTDPTLQNAYQAFNGGDLPRAQQQYEAALRADPNNRDALLGTAAVALRQNQQQQAAAVYNRLLDLDPNDADALAGLMGLRQGDASQAELRLKSILNRTPDAAPVQFALGNLYARQGRWPEAQQAYFRAWSAAPGNADYAYNLAIGLDRLNQGKLALTYYQKALALAQDGPVGFDRAVLRQRMHQLANPGQQ